MNYEEDAKFFIAKLIEDALRHKGGNKVLEEALSEVTDLPEYCQQLINGWLDAENKYFAEHPVALVEGFNELLDWLNTQPVLKIIATNSDRWRADHMLSKVGLQGRFDDMWCGDEVEFRKPHPEMCLKLMNKHALSTDQVVFLEDSPVSLKAGIEAGIQVLQVFNLFPLMDDHHANVDKVGNMYEAKAWLSHRLEELNLLAG